MTGEFTLSGLVLPVGGIKEKILAGQRAGITKILIPKRNIKDLVEIPEQQRKLVEVIGVTDICQVLKLLGFKYDSEPALARL